MPQYQVAVAKSRYAILKHLTKSIVNAEEVYYLANGKYTGGFEDLDINMPGGKLDNSIRHKYYYNWGRCQLAISPGLAYCVNDHTKMYYQLYFRYASMNSGQRACGVFETFNPKMAAIRVCQQETEKTQPDYEGDSPYSLWIYP